MTCFRSRSSDQYSPNHDVVSATGPRSFHTRPEAQPQNQSPGSPKYRNLSPAPSRRAFKRGTCRRFLMTTCICLCLVQTSPSSPSLSSKTVPPHESFYRDEIQPVVEPLAARLAYLRFPYFGASDRRMGLILQAFNPERLGYAVAEPRAGWLCNP